MTSHSDGPAGNRLSMVAQQRESIAGAELLARCHGVTADGRLAAWRRGRGSNAYSNGGFPVLAHVRWAVEQVLADGRHLVLLPLWELCHNSHAGERDDA